MTKRSFSNCLATGLGFRIARNSEGDYSKEVASFDVSLGNPRCSGAALDCILNWASGKFLTYEFSLADTLYAPILALPELRHLVPQEFRCSSSPSLAMGDDWIENNSTIIAKNLGASYTIRRWTSWQKHPEMRETKEMVKALFESQLLANLIKEDCEAFFRRKTNGVPSDVALGTLTDFYIEECSAYFLHSRDVNVRHIYPGKSLAVLRYLANNAVEGYNNRIIEVFRAMKRTDIDIRA